MTQLEGKPDKAACCLHGRGAFYASVALNLFLLGAVAAPLLGGRGGHMMPPPPPPGGYMIDRMARELPPADAEKLRDIYAQTVDNFRNKHEGGRESFQKIAAILKQDAPDLVALQAALDALQAEGQKFHADMGQALKRLATEMPLESRRKIADFMEKSPMMRGKGDHREGPPPMPDHGPEADGPQGEHDSPAQP